ncbi:MAG TPA: MauE/DoxX family redox-associated membrane protein [Polyangia bacterium]|nr:MauE/DoxX family redox-associated membrane protein [Polyangia bacterium]
MDARRIVAGAARFVAGALLVVAGALKLRAPGDFATEIANYQLFPALAPYLAAVLPVVEVFVGGALVVAPRGWRRPAALASLALFTMFTVAVAAAYFRRINVDCGCFGTGGGPITALTLLRDLGLVAASIVALVTERAPSRPSA